MKRHLFIFFAAVLLAVVLNGRGGVLYAAPAGMPVSDEFVLSATNDSGKVETAREANSLFLPPSAHNAIPGDNGPQTVRLRSAETITFTTQAAVRTFQFPVTAASFVIARNGAFHRAADYYVYTLRRIVI